MPGILELRLVSKKFATHVAVDGITLNVAKGSFFSLLGPSGCGKTTTLRMIAGFEDATSGDILLNGSRINALPPYQRNVSTVFQNYALFPHLRVSENIEFGLRRQRAQDIQRRVAEVIDLVQLSGKENRFPSQLSGGEKQRVALARSLVLRPDVLLLDEPLSALDPNLRTQVRAELKRIQKQVGITFLFVTHDQEEAMSLSDRIAVMHQGKLEQEGTPEEIYLRPATRFVAGFLGKVNWFHAVGVRPESTRVSRTAPGHEARSVQATVRSSTFLGNCVHIEAGLDSGCTAVAQVSREENCYVAGEPVHLWWKPCDEIQPPQ